MANATTIIYPKFLEKVTNGAITDLDAADLRLMLLDNTHVYAAADDFVDDVVAEEHDGAGYVRIALTSEAITANAQASGMKLDADDVTFASLAAGTNDVRHAALFAFVTNDADSILIGLMTLNSDYAPSGVDFIVSWNAAGIFQMINNGPFHVTEVDADSAAAQKVLNITTTSGIEPGDTVGIDHLDAGAGREFGIVDTVQDGVSVTLLVNLGFTHTGATGSPVSFWH
jgi:hypothetical protein